MKKCKTECKLEVVERFGPAKAFSSGATVVSARGNVPYLGEPLHDRDQPSSRQVAAVYGIRNPNQAVVWRRNFDEGGVEALGGGGLLPPSRATA